MFDLFSSFSYKIGLTIIAFHAFLRLIKVTLTPQPGFEISILPNISIYKTIVMHIIITFYNIIYFSKTSRFIFHTNVAKTIEKMAMPLGEKKFTFVKQRIINLMVWDDDGSVLCLENHLTMANFPFQIFLLKWATF